MARRRRSAVGVTFSLAFLDIMAGGLGAVVLLFLIIHHSVEVRAVETHRELHQQVASLESEVLRRQRTAETLAEKLEDRRATLAQVRERADRIAAQVESAPEPDPARRRLARLQAEVRQLEAEVAEARERAESGDAARERPEEAQRQYLTGLQVEGRRVLFLVDTSASMLADRIVRVIRRRNMSAQQRRASPKWRRALAAMDWMSAQLPAGSRFQIYSVADDAGSVLPNSDGRWLQTADRQRLNAAVEALRNVVPSGGSNLAAGLRAARSLQPGPDTIYLVTDSLPTQGREGGQGGTVSPQERQRLFQRAMNQRPQGAKVNVVLLPMEGDPAAAVSYWQLARSTGGTLVAPARDWP